MNPSKSRIAVSTYFSVNGFLFANWTARLPELQEFYGISNSLIGMLLFSSAAGALLAMPFSGWLSVRFGSSKITAYMALLFCLAVPLLSLSPVLYLGAFFFFIHGLSTGALDVAMNGQAVFVERAYKKSIMSSFHAFFSVGMALGAGSGALFAKFDVPLTNHLTVLALICAVFCLWASYHLIDDRPQLQEGADKKSKSFMLPAKALIPLGIIAFCTMTGEGSMADWSAIYMTQIVGQDEFFSAIAFGSFGAAMTIGRIFGDSLIEHIGKYKLLIYDSLIALSGLVLALAYPSTWTCITGFFLIGLGLATMVPIAYSTAGNTKGVDPSVGIAMVTTIGYAGFFVGPPTIGVLSDSFDLRIGMGFVLFLFVLMLILSILIKRANRG